MTEEQYNLFEQPITEAVRAFVANSNVLKVKKLDPDAKLPTKAHTTDLGYDLYALEHVELVPGEVTKVRTGIACKFPQRLGALIRDRSSVATKKEVFVVAGVIDELYTGEVLVAFYNPGNKELNFTDSVFGVGKVPTGVNSTGTVTFEKGEKIAQMILIPTITQPVIEVDVLPETERGDGGFGSTGTT